MFLTVVYLSSQSTNGAMLGDGEVDKAGVLSNILQKGGNSGSPKPFAYIPGGIDLKEFKQRKK